MVLLYDPGDAAGPPDDVDAPAPKLRGGAQEPLPEELSGRLPRRPFGLAAEVPVVDRSHDALAAEGRVEVGLEELAAQGPAAGLRVLSSSELPPPRRRFNDFFLLSFFFLRRFRRLLLAVVISFSLVLPHRRQRLLHQSVHHRGTHGEVVDADFRRGLHRRVSL